MKLARGGGGGADHALCSVQMPPPRPREGHCQQQQEAAWSLGEWEKAGRCTGLLWAEDLPQDPSQDPTWRVEGAGVLFQPPLHCQACSQGCEQGSSARQRLRQTGGQVRQGQPSLGQSFRASRIGTVFLIGVGLSTAP